MQVCRYVARSSRYTRTRLASAGVPGGARRQPRTNVDTKPRPELLRTTVQRACVPRPDHGGPSERPPVTARADTICGRSRIGGRARSLGCVTRHYVVIRVRDSACATLLSLSFLCHRRRAGLTVTDEFVPRRGVGVGEGSSWILAAVHANQRRRARD